MSYDILLLDNDRTLLDFDKGEKKAVTDSLKSFNVRANKKICKNYAEINNSLWLEHEKGLIEKKDLIVKRFKILFEKYSLNIDPVAFSVVYEHNLAKSTQRIKHAKKLLLKLKKLGKRVYIVTNGTATVQNSRLDLSGLRKYFSGVFISEETGYAKPDARYFEYCFSHIDNFDKEKTLLVGDSESADIQGAKNAGIKSCLFSPHGVKPTQADYVITDLLQLLKII